MYKKKGTKSEGDGGCNQKVEETKKGKKEKIYTTKTNKSIV